MQQTDKSNSWITDEENKTREINDQYDLQEDREIQPLLARLMSRNHLMIYGYGQRELT